MKLFFILTAGLAFLGACSTGDQSINTSGQFKPGSAEYLTNEGIFFLNDGNLTKAEEKLTAALKKNPNLVNAYNALGLVYTYRRDFDKAIANFKKVLQLDANFFDAYNSLGMVYTERGEYEKAKENLLMAANAQNYRTPENAYTNLALLEFRNNRLDAALRYVDKGLELNKQFPPLHNLKGIILENQNHLAEAADSYQKALSLLTEPDVTYLINLGKVYVKLGEKKKAIDTLEKALGKDLDQASRQEILKTIKEIEKSQ